MSTETRISDEDLKACANLKTREDFARLLEQLRSAGTGLDIATIVKQACSPNPLQQARAFLLLAGSVAKPEGDVLLTALASKEEVLTTTAAFCVASCCADDDALLRELLLGATSWEPSKISKDARYWLLTFLGLSGDDRCSPVLLEALQEHAHFCAPSTTVRALEALGCEIPPNVDRQDVSISVDPGSEGILITTDEKFSGYSSCPDCRFFPCRINRYYPGAIQDCSFWNRTDPQASRGIRDLRRSEPT